MFWVAKNFNLDISSSKEDLGRGSMESSICGKDTAKLQNEHIEKIQICTKYECMHGLHT
jgi:hypothetical protein